VRALGEADTARRARALLGSREHQDAQELFQLLAECVKAEAGAVERERARDRGFAPGVPGSPGVRRALPRSPFDGLTANRRSCDVCGYAEALMHFGFDTWTLALPRTAVRCRPLFITAGR
jgi:ubiquitin carboxyl-terminal hydrolase 1